MGCLFNSADVQMVDEVSARIKEVLDELDETSGVDAIKALYKELGQAYVRPDSLPSLEESTSSGDIEDLVQFIRDFVSDEGYIDLLGDNEDMYFYLTNAQTITGFINPSTASNFEPRRIDDTRANMGTASKKRSEVKRLIINRAYGTASQPRMLMERQLSRGIVETFLVDFDNAAMVTTNRQVNENIIRYKRKLFNNVIRYLRQRYGASDYEGQIDAIQTMYDAGDYQDALDALSTFATKTLNMTVNELNGYYNQYDDITSNAKVALDAFNSYFILSNFDSLLVLKLDKAIKIRDDLFNQETNTSHRSRGNNPLLEKYSLGDTQNTTHSWRDEKKEISAAEEIGDINRLIIESCPMYVFGEANPMFKGTLGLKAFNHVLALLKRLEHNAIGNTKLTSGSGRIFDPAVEGKTLKQVVAALNEDPVAQLPIIFKLFSNKAIYKLLDLKELGMTNTDKNIIYSIYKNFFDTGNEHSLVSIWQKTPSPNATNYYNYIGQMCSSVEAQEFLQYYEEEGVIKARTLRDSLTANARRDIENKISGNWSILASSNFAETAAKYGLSYGSYSEYPLDMLPNFVGEGGKYFQFKVGNLTILQDKETYDITITRNGLKLDKPNESVFKELLPFFKEILCLDFSYDPTTNQYSNFTKCFLSLDSQVNEPLFNISTLNALGIAARILTNVYVNNCDYFKNYTGDLNSYEAHLKQVLGENPDTRRGRFVTSRVSLEIELVDSHYTSELESLAVADAMNRDIFGDDSMKDADGKTLPSIGLSMLATKFRNQWQYQNMRPNSASRHFNILSASGPFRGIQFYRDFKGTDENKKAIKHNEAEHFMAGLYDFLRGMIPNERGVLQEAMFLPSVISDKSKIIKILIDLGVKSPKGKAYKNLTVDEIYDLIDSSLGKYFGAIIQHNLDLFDMLNKFVQTFMPELFTTTSGVVHSIDPRDHFKSFNDLVLNPEDVINNLNDRIQEALQTIALYESLSPELITPEITNDIENQNNKIAQYTKYINILQSGSASDVMHELIVAYLNALPSLLLDKSYKWQLLELTVQISHVYSDGKLRNNMSLIALAKRFNQSIVNSFTNYDGVDLDSDGYPIYYEMLSKLDFWDRKRLDLVSELLAKQVVISTYDDLGVDIADGPNRKQPELALLRSAKFMYLQPNEAGRVISHTEAGYDSYTGDIILAKLLFDDGTHIDITSSSSIADLLYLYNGEIVKGNDPGFDLRQFVANGLKPSYIRLRQQVGYSRYGTEGVKHYEVSSKGDPRFSTMNARFAPGTIIFGHDVSGRTIESVYQHGVKQNDWYTDDNNKTGAPRSKEIITGNTEDYSYNLGYLPLWLEWAKQNPELIEELRSKVEGAELTDQFASTAVSQARALALILNDSNPKVANGITKVSGLVVNPILEKFNALDFLFSQEFMNSTVGTFENHPSKQKASDEGDYSLMSDLIDEALRWMAQVKRNVSLSATKHSFARGLLNGIASEYTIAVVEDDKDVVYNIMGQIDPKGATPFDGSTFVDPTANYLENNSLGDAKAGTDKKQFVHGYKEETGTGILVKTAGFALTNERIKACLYFQRMNRQMMNRKWLTKDGTQLFVTNILESYQLETNPDGTIKMVDGKPVHKKIDYGKIFYKRGKGYCQVLMNKAKYLGNNTYEITEINVDESGSRIGLKEYTRTVKIESNWDLWNVFGGYNSVELQPVTSGSKLMTMVASENSIRLLVKAMNSIGEVTKGELNGNKVYSQSDIYQNLKHSNINYIVTAGAIKQGGANINSKKAYFDDNFLMATMKLDMRDSGIQLDAEHHADESVLSIMTQVVNALGSRGYTNPLAQEAYEALYSLTCYGIKDYMNGLSAQFDTVDEEGNVQPANPDKLLDAIAKTVANALVNTSPTDGDLLNFIAIQITEEARRGKRIRFKDLEGNLPGSHPVLFDKLNSALNSALTKQAIKLKFPGVLSVLNPSNRIWLLHGDKLRSQFTEAYDKNGNLIPFEETEEVKRLLRAESHDINRKKISDVLLGHRYHLVINGLSEKVHISDPYKYWELKERLKGLDYKTDFHLYEDVVTGRDLATYDVKFKGTYIDEAGNEAIGNFNLYDLDVIRLLYTITEAEDLIKKAKKKIKSLRRKGDINGAKNLYITTAIKVNNLLSSRGVTPTVNGQVLTVSSTLEGLDDIRKLVRRDLLDALNAFYTKRDMTVKIDGKDVKIDQESTDVHPYELIMDKSYASKFGLRVGDTLQEIQADKQFFLKRMLENWETHADASTYEIELKRLNGDHVYLKSKDAPVAKGLRPIKLQTIRDGEHLYRLEADGETKKYKLANENDVIYFDDATGQEIIETDDLEFYLNNAEYAAITLSSKAVALQVVKTAYDERIDYTYKDSQEGFWILDAIRNSNNQAAKEFVEIFEDNYVANAEVIEGQSEPMKLLGALTKYVLDIDAKQRQLKRLYDSEAQKAKREAKGTTQEALKMIDEDPIIRQFKKNARALYASFIKSLDFLAARIPSQSMQSFMPMRVVAFDNSGVNSAYVNIWQIWLQGSDFDIDKVSLLGNWFNKSGQYVTWTPFSNILKKENIKALENMPFPTGIRTRVDEKSLNGAAFVSQYFVTKENSNGIFEFDKKGNVRLTYGTTGLIKNLVSFIREINKNGLNITEDIVIGENTINKDKANDIFLKFINEHNSYISGISTLRKAYSESDINAYKPYELLKDFGALFVKEGDTYKLADLKNNKQLKKTFNRLLRTVKLNNYTLYYPESLKGSEAINKLTESLDRQLSKGLKNAEEMIMNFITSAMFRISSNPANLVQSQSSIDDPTEIGKDRAKRSKAAKKLDYYAPGSVMDKYETLLLTLTGKEDVGISASSMKTFEAITQHGYATLSKDGQEDLARRLLIKRYYLKNGEIQEAYGKRICGTSAWLPANIWVDGGIDTINGYSYNQSIKSALVQGYRTVNNDDDAYLTMSAFISLSADNAKDPTLTKLNAGPDTLGLYTAGTTLINDFQILADTMMSKTGDILTSLLNGNIFQGRKKRSLATVLKYIDQGPTIKSTLKVLNLFTEEDGKTIINPKSIRHTIYEAIKDLNDLRFATKVTEAQYNEALDRVVDELVNRVREIEAEGFKVLSNTEQIALAKYVDKLIDYINTIKTVYSDVVDTVNALGEHVRFSPYYAIKDLYAFNLEMGALRSLLKLNQGLPNKASETISFNNNFENIFLDRWSEMTDVERQATKPAIDLAIADGILDEYGKVDLSRFVADDPTYRNLVAELYDKVKFAVNIFDIIWNVPHYRGYLTAYTAQLQALSLLSAKFRAMRANQEWIGELLKHVTPAQVQKDASRMGQFFNNVMNNLWLMSDDHSVWIPAGTTLTLYKSNDETTQVTLTEDYRLQLGTPEANATFKRWMEETVFKDLKRMYSGLNNIFIDDLYAYRNDRTVSKNAAAAYTLPISMLPRSDSERSRFKEYKSAFNNLRGLAPYAGIPITDLVYYYNLITYRNESNQHSFTSIFEEMIADGQMELDNQYRLFISVFDRRSDFVLDRDFTRDLLLEYCAEKGNPQSSQARLIRVYDKVNRRYRLATLTDKALEKMQGSPFDDSRQSRDYSDDEDSEQEGTDDWGFDANDFGNDDDGDYGMSEDELGIGGFEEDEEESDIHANTDPVKGTNYRWFDEVEKLDVMDLNYFTGTVQSEGPSGSYGIYNLDHNITFTRRNPSTHEFETVTIPKTLLSVRMLSGSSIPDIVTYSGHLEEAQGTHSIVQLVDLYNLKHKKDEDFTPISTKDLEMVYKADLTPDLDAYMDKFEYLFNNC